ncbi:hypothetical protein [Salinigranum marinum]|uniref:DUF7857 domain-containing protein n=1 Tax=Salinigranum marinum TaxID=1515595 RepID=UPI002989EFD1|nr:hypothetical protein [Salinigranum marinum]
MYAHAATPDGACDRPTDRTGDHDRDCAHDHDRDRGSIGSGALVVDWHVSRVNETTLVTVRVENTRTHPRRVRIDNLLDGPVSPPRRRGVAERGWDDDGLTCSLAGGERMSVGYACRAPPARPPISVRDDPANEETTPPAVERALRSLGDHAPPRAALPDDSERRPDPDRRDGPVPADTADGADAVESAADEPGSSPAANAGIDEVESAAHGDRSPPSVPTTVAAWFAAVEARLETADRLAGDLREATPVVASLGGRAGVETLAATLDDDSAALRRVAVRATALADRVDETDVPDVGGNQ